MENRFGSKYVNIPANNIPANNIIPANNRNNTTTTTTTTTNNNNNNNNNNLIQCLYLNYYWTIKQYDNDET
jgi:hypothetical protein